MTSVAKMNGGVDLMTMFALKVVEMLSSEFHDAVLFIQNLEASLL